MTAIEVEPEPRRELVGDLPSEYDCAGCERRARVWVDVGLPDPEPCCRRCASRVARSDTFKQALADLAQEAPGDELPPRRPAVSPPQPAVVSPPRPLTRSDAARRSAALRRKCAQCDMVTSPPNLALHQRAIGHTGYEEVQ